MLLSIPMMDEADKSRLVEDLVAAVAPLLTKAKDEATQSMAAMKEAQLLETIGRELMSALFEAISGNGTLYF